MQPTPPFWFHQRQAKLEAAGSDVYRVTAPNAPEAFIGLLQGKNFGKLLVRVSDDPTRS